MNIQKVIVISAAVSAAVIIWYEVFGVSFLIALGVIVACLVAFSREK